MSESVTFFFCWFWVQKRVLDGEDFFVNKEAGPFRSVADLWDHEARTDCSVMISEGYALFFHE
jgi:hypothetical protein